MAPRHQDLATVEETTVTKKRGPINDESFNAKIRSVIPDTGRLTMQGYVKSFFTKLQVADATLHIFKKMKVSGTFSKMGEWRSGEVEPDNAEATIFQTWGSGLYQLRPEYHGRYYSPVSMAFRVGEVDDEAVNKHTTAEDTQATIDTTIRQLGHVAVAHRLKGLTEPDTPSVAPGGGNDTVMTMMMEMMRQSEARSLEMMRQSEARAARAEERLEKMMDRLSDMKKDTTAAQGPLLAEVFKSAVTNPDTLALLMGQGPEKVESWMDVLKDMAREFAPAIKGMIDTMMVSRMTTVPPTVALPAAPGTATDKMSVPTMGGRPSPPQPARPPQGDGMAPMPLNEEQQMAKDNLVAFISEGDFENAFAVLESFPGFIPGQGGLVPLGEFFLSQINPKASPRVYLPQIAMIVPELKTIMDKTIPFIQHVQKKLTEMAEAAQAKRPEMAPTQSEDDGDDDDE
jgi:hypothetical protein